MDAQRGDLRPCLARANKFREVEGEGTAWYASRTEAVGLGRVVPSSSLFSFLDFSLSFSFVDTLELLPFAG
jgi:hypothetical protein